MVTFRIQSQNNTIGETISNSWYWNTKLILKHSMKDRGNKTIAKETWEQ